MRACLIIIAVTSGCLPGGDKSQCRTQNDCFAGALCIDGVCVAEAHGPLPAPVLQATLQNQQVVLRWDAIAGATAYNVFRKDPGASAAYQVASLTAPPYQDALPWNSCDTYAYTVYASQALALGLASNALDVSPHDPLACWSVARKVPHWRAAAADAQHAFAWSSDGLARSDDGGTSWSAAVASPGLPANPVALLDQGGVLTAIGMSQIASSSDGESFTGAAVSDHFVAAAADATRLAIFTADGDAWWGASAGTLAAAAHPPRVSLAAAASGGGIFVAVGDHGALYTSADAQSWQPQLVPTAHAFVALGFATGFAAIDDAGDVLTPTDATYATWQLARTGGFSGATAIGAAGSTLIAFADGGLTLSSADWTAAPAHPLPAHRIEAAANGAVAIAVGEADTRIVCAPTCSVSSADTSLRAVAAAGQVLAVGTDGGVVRSNDRVSWTHARIDTLATLTAVATSAGVWVTVADDGAIYRSSDGAQWAQARVPTGVALRSVAGNGSLFVAVGDQASVFTSSDGAAWNAQSVPVNVDLSGVIYGVGQWAMVTSDGRSLRSQDAINWGAANIVAPGCTIAGLRFALGNFVAFGAGGFVSLSPDGQSWASRPLPVADAVATASSSGTTLVVAAGASLYAATGTAPWQPLRVSTAASPPLRDLLPDVSLLVGDDGFVATK